MTRKWKINFGVTVDGKDEVMWRCSEMVELQDYETIADQLSMVSGQLAEARKVLAVSVSATSLEAAQSDIVRLKAALATLAAQTSGRNDSSSLSDSMATLAKVALDQVEMNGAGE